MKSAPPLHNSISAYSRSRPAVLGSVVYGPILSPPTPESPIELPYASAQDL